MRKSIFSFTQENEEKKEQIMTGWNISTQQICWKQKDKKIAKCAHKFQNSCIILFTSNISRGKEKSENKNKNNNMNWENAMNKQTHYTILKKNESNAALSLFHRSVFMSFDVNTFGCRNNVKNVRSGCKVFQLDLYYKLAMKNNTVSTVLECAFHLWKKNVNGWTTMKWPLKLNHKIIAFIPWSFGIFWVSTNEFNLLRKQPHTTQANQILYDRNDWILRTSETRMLKVSLTCAFFYYVHKKSNCQNKENIKSAHKRLTHKIRYESE